MAAEKSDPLLHRFLQTVGGGGGRVEDGLAQEAHRFASNAASFGATKLPEVAFALEWAARPGDRAVACARLHELRDACEELHAAIRRINLARI